MVYGNCRRRISATSSGVIPLWKMQVHRWPLKRTPRLCAAPYGLRLGRGAHCPRRGRAGARVPQPVGDERHHGGGRQAQQDRGDDEQDVDELGDGGHDRPGDRDSADDDEQWHGVEPAAAVGVGAVRVSHHGPPGCIWRRLAARGGSSVRAGERSASRGAAHVGPVRDSGCQMI